MAIAGLGMSAQAFADGRGFTVEDMVKMERVVSPVVSPDGKLVVYAQRSTDVEKNRSRWDLWQIDLTDAQAVPRKLTNLGSNNDGNNSGPQWSAKGDAIYFVSSRSGSGQVWRLPIAGGAAQKVTDFPIDVESFKVSPRENRIAIAMEVFRDCADLSCTKNRLEDKAKVKASGRLHDKLFIRHWDTWADGRRNVLFSSALDANHIASSQAVSLSGGLEADVHSKPDGDQEDYTFTPDGNQIVFSARIAGKTEAWSTNFDLFKVPATGGSAPQNLTAENPAWDAKPSFSPDGNTLAYLAMKRPGFEADRFQIMLMDVKTGKKRPLAENWDRSATNLNWSADGQSLFTTAFDLGQLRLFKIDIASGKVSALSDQGSVAGYDIQGNSAVIAKADLRSAVQLFHSDLNKANWRQITSVNQQALANVRFGDFEQFSYAGAKGEKVYGYVMKPWNAEAGKKYPVAFIVHGGPQGSFANNWSYRWNPQTYAGAGYAVVFIDFHGSLGYGQAFTDSISQDWGGKPLVDLKLGMAAAAKQFPWLDSSKACALGASYGGFMMNWIAGNWSDGFKCIVNHAGIFDSRSMYYTTEELWFTEWENGGPYFKVPAKHEKFNPSAHVTKWKTPMLVTQGELDFRVPSAQSFGAFTALQRQGIDSQLLTFPDENHHILKPANSILWHNTVLNWMNKHLK
ncbi:S9 family peptidase [Undibacterium sp. FT137W]|uniref:S9 family peptidase n=2 Tax=Undibacterium fentianense TaxID=2828728 RepID=A0A941E1F2_9BURK|nr:S9 family peptidase [Undibacterium fentianense]